MFLSLHLRPVPSLSCVVSVLVRSYSYAVRKFILPTPYWPLMKGSVELRGAVPVEVSVFTRLQDPSFDLEVRFLCRHHRTEVIAFLYYALLVIMCPYGGSFATSAARARECDYTAHCWCVHQPCAQPDGARAGRAACRPDRACGAASQLGTMLSCLLYAVMIIRRASLLRLYLSGCVVGSP